MYSPTIIVLSLVLGLLTCSDANLGTDKPSGETPSQVVAKYVSLARDGEFQKAVSLTTSSLPSKQTSVRPSAISENKKEVSNSGNAEGYTIVPDPNMGAKAMQDWVASDFAKSIHDGNLSVKAVKNESVKDIEARVEIILGNEKTVDVLGWIFLLRKVDDKWKIYNVTTAGDPLAPLK